MKKIKIFIVGNSLHYADWIKNSKIVDNIELADIVFFTGGEDVTPSLYNEEANPKTYNNPVRDFAELDVFKSVDHKKQLCLGVCRGSQLLTCLSGGKLVQHCNNHGCWNGHNITFDDGTEELITSTHHQMMFPYNLDNSKYNIIAWSSETRSDVHESVDWKDDYVEPEIVYYNETNCLCIQGHPEMMNETTIHEKLNSLINFYLNK